MKGQADTPLTALVAQESAADDARAKALNPNQVVTLLLRDKSGAPQHSGQISRKELVRRVMAKSIAKQVLNLAHKHHVTEKGQRIRLDPQWRQIYADPSTDQRIISAAQRGKTLYQIVKTLAQLSLGLKVGWVMPKDNKVQELVHAKLDPTIKNTPLYRELQRLSEGHDTVRLKTFGPFATLHIVTCNSKDELTSFSADCMHIDERDFCNRMFLPMYPSRMNFSSYKLTDEISTPTVEGSLSSDNIHSEFLSGDQHRYFTTCPHCQTEQILDWFDNVVDSRYDDSGRIVEFNVRDQDWSEGGAQDIRVCCRNPQCKRPFDRTIAGRWAALQPDRILRTYWVEALASEIGPSLATLLTTFRRSLGNPTRMQQFMNMDLGRPYAGGVMRFDHRMFERACDHTRSMATSSERPTTIGIDVNVPWFDVQISQWEGSRQIKIFAAKLESKDQIIALVDRFNIVGGCIDNQPETRLAIKLQEDIQAKTGAAIVRCKYATNDQALEMTITEKGENEFDPPRLITVNRTVAIDALYEAMLGGQVRWFDGWKHAIQGEMFKEFNTPVRALEIGEDGNERYVWKNKPDHQMHAAVFDRIAGEVLGMAAPRDYSDVLPAVNSISHGGSAKTPPRDPDIFDSVMIQRG